MFPGKFKYLRKAANLHPGPCSWIITAFCFAFLTLLLSGNLGMLPLRGSEGRWAMISRHMYRTGDIFQSISGISFYWDKPLLSYWAVLPFAFFNGSVTEAVVRLPSVISGVLLLLLTFNLARTWFGTRTAILSAAILGSTNGFLFWARNAQVEMLNAFFIFLSIWLFLRHKSDKHHGWIYLIGIVMGIGANMKGLPVYAVPVFAILLLIMVKRKWPPALTKGHCFAAAGLSLTIYLSFPLLACYSSGTWDPLKMVWHENVVRFFSPFDHKDPVWTYFIRIFDLAAPWSFILPPALVYLFPKLLKHKVNIVELITLFSAIFLFFTLSGSRRPYYLLPILPFASIIMARLFAEFPGRMLARPIDLWIKIFGFLSGILFMAPLVAFLFYPDLIPSLFHKVWPAAIIAALASVLMIASTATRRIEGMAGSIIAVWLIYIFSFIPVGAQFSNFRTEIAEVKSLNKPCGFFMDQDDKFLFYFDHPYKLFHDEKSAYNWAVRTGGVLLVKNEVLKEHWQLKVKTHKWRAMLAVSPKGSRQNKM